MIIKLLFSIFLITFLFANDNSLDNLLNRYNEKKALHHKTKIENAGFVIVYTRKDLDLIQAYTLKDVLKSVRMLTYRVNAYGITQLAQSSLANFGSSKIRIYINDNELSSPSYGSALSVYSDMDIDFIDHIEIYQSGSSISFGNEPSYMVIKLYTKEPIRENGNSVSFSVDNLNSKALSYLSAKKLDNNISYLFYINKNNIENDNNENSKNNSNNIHLHTLVKKEDNYELQLDYYSKQKDIYGQNSIFKKPEGGNRVNSQKLFAYKKYFKDDLTLIISAIEAESEILANYYDTKLKTDNSIYTYGRESVYKIILNKKLFFDNNFFLFGAQFQQNSYTLLDYQKNSISQGNPYNDLNKLNIFMLYGEHQYDINLNNYFITALKFDYYDNDKKQDGLYQLRVSYISHLSENLTLKAFSVYRYLYPTFLQTSLSNSSNPNLDAQKIFNYNFEILYKDEKSDFSLGIGEEFVKNPIYLNDKTNRFENSNEEKDIKRFYMQYSYNFTYKDKIKLEYFKSFKDKDYVAKYPTYGVLVQLFNEFEKFDIFNELIYRNGYRFSFMQESIKIEDGYDYNLGIIYNYKKYLSFKLKGENLLNLASKTPIIGIGAVNPYDRRVIFSMEYFF